MFEVWCWCWGGGDCAGQFVAIELCFSAYVVFFHHYRLQLAAAFINTITTFHGSAATTASTTNHTAATPVCHLDQRIKSKYSISFHLLCTLVKILYYFSVYLTVSIIYTFSYCNCGSITFSQQLQLLSILSGFSILLLLANNLHDVLINDLTVWTVYVLLLVIYSTRWAIKSGNCFFAPFLTSLTTFFTAVYTSYSKHLS